MIYGLNYVSPHSLHRLNAAMGAFLQRSAADGPFDEALIEDWLRPVVTKLPRLGTLLRALHVSLQAATIAQRNEVVRLFGEIDRINEICGDVRQARPVLDSVAATLHEPLRQLFDYLYDQGLNSSALTGALSATIDDFYEKFRDLDQAVCPFCGLSLYMDRGSGNRAPIDHFLPRLIYPMGAVNFRNLVPMCTTCNQRPQKGTIDPILAEGGTRRVVYYPYAAVGGIRVQVNCLAWDGVGTRGQWAVGVAAISGAEQDCVLTWENIFRIVIRWAAHVAERIREWITEFFGLRQFGAVPDVATLRSEFTAEGHRLAGVSSRREPAVLLKSAVFAYLGASAPDPVLSGFARLAESGVVRGRKLAV